MTKLTPQPWPNLSSPQLEATAQTLQLWSQIVGKIRLRATPWLNHSWHATLYVSARGLTVGRAAIEDRIARLGEPMMTGLELRDRCLD